MGWAFLIRWGCAFVLVAATFNPTEWSYVRWATENYGAQLPLAVLLGLILAIAYIIYIRATLRSIGGLGMALVLGVVGALLWVLYDWGVLSLANSDLNIWMGLVALSLVLGVGLSWSIIRRTLSGQYDMDDVEE